MSKSTTKNAASRYRKLDEKDHIRNRQDMYIGDKEVRCSEMFIYDPVKDKVSFEKVEYSAGLLKIFDEILVNATDNYQRNVGTSYISTTFTDDMITVENDGESIPIEYFEDTETYIPEVIFTQLRTGSNFDDDEERTTGGRNGYGCKLTTIMSTLFEIDIVNNHKRYVQLVENGCELIHPPKITKTHETDRVKISFVPDFEIFDIEKITNDMKVVMYKRVHDLSYLNLELLINDRKIPQHTWDSFVASYKIFKTSYTHEYQSESNPALIWKVAFGFTEKPRTASFVNYIPTYDGGTHVDHIYKQLSKAIKDHLSKSIAVTGKQIKSHLSFVISAIIINPKFTSQAKEKLVLPISKFGSKCILPEPFIKKFLKNTDFKTAFAIKYTKNMNNARKKTRVTTIEKLVEANYAGTQESHKCTLFICEGLSAKTMVDTGMCILGHDYYGCYPLKGKIMNTFDVTDIKYQKNEVLNNLKTVLGLDDNAVYESVKPLRYGKVVCVKDADSDGASIMGLAMNFFHTKFESLLKIPGFFSEFISPMIQIIPKSKGKAKIPFYNEVEYKRFIEEQAKNPTFGPFTVKFIKGLATNEDDDIKQYFKHYNDNCIPIVFDKKYPANIDLAYNKKKANARKKWLTTITPDTHLPREKGKPIKCTDFINNDLVLYSMDSCVRSIPSVVDGLKPSQRKILYTLLRMPVSKSKVQMKVFQLGGLVAKTSNYHHGDASMNGTIIKMAQDFPGSNNIPFLQRSGQFGSRQENGDDAGQPRYISCCLAEITRYIFPAIDDVILTYKEEDNQTVEPVYYVPIIPTVLINGITGVGTGWSTTIPAYNPYDVIRYTRKLISRSKEKVIIRPYCHGFKGTISVDEDVISYDGIFKVRGREVDILEIPIGNKISDLQKLLNSYSDDQKKTVLRNRKKTEIVIPAKISSFENNNESDANSVNFHVVLKEVMDKEEIINFFSLHETVRTSNLTAFDSESMIKRYDDIYDMLMDWFAVRYDFYNKRIDYQIAEMEKKVKVLSNKARFIKENVEETIVVRNKSKATVENILIDRKFDKIDGKYDYLLEMSIYWLTKEKYEQLIRDLEELNKQLEALKNTTAEIEWDKDLKALEAFMTKHEVCIEKKQMDVDDSDEESDNEVKHSKKHTSSDDESDTNSDNDE